MKWWEITLFMICTCFCYFAHIKAYSLLFKSKVKTIEKGDAFLIFFIVLATYYNTFHNYGFSKILISFIGTFIIMKIIYKENLKTTFIKTILIYLLGWILEMLFSVVFVYFFYSNLQQIDQNIIFKVSFSALIMLMMLLSSYNKRIRKIFSNIYNDMNKILNLIIIIIFFIISLVALSYYLIITTNIFSSITIIILLIILIFLCILSIIQVIKGKKADEKQEILLNFMKEYEMLIDNERVAKHEMVNNLLILKSIKNRNTKEYENILEEILESYKARKSYKGLYDLPSGLKGLFYYKIYDMKNKNIEVFINISDRIIKNLDSLSSKSLSKLCKILGILLDNASEAAEKANNKLVIIDAYEENENLLIYIENTMLKRKIDINKIKNKGFSTKGKNRGYGLFLIDKVLNETNKLELIQKIENDKFISIVKIKK